MAIQLQFSQRKTLKQRPVITKRLRRSIALLQYTSADLLHFVESISTENPFLEVEINYHAPLKKQKSSNAEKNGSSFFENIPSHEQELSLYEYLQNQVVILSKHLSSAERKFLNFLIENLDDRGYLTIDISEAAFMLDLPVETGEKALRILQSLEPAGIGARNLAECLILQLRRKRGINPRFFIILEDYFTEFVNKKWSKIEKELNIPRHEIQNLLDIVRNFNFRPGAAFTSEPVNFLIPDIIITKKDNTWAIQLMDDVLFRVKFNHRYYNSLKDSQDVQLQNYMREKYQQYVWLKNSIAHRKKTMLNLMEVLIKKQEKFFLSQKHQLQPMTMKECANLIGVHESTVSRIVKNKFVHAPSGTFPLKDLFTSSFTAVEDSGSVTQLSSRSVQHEILKIIEREDKTNPYSDQMIAKLLQEKGIKISRRTVSKYRKQLHIPSSTMRKRIVQ
mgnify:FL=1